MTFEQYCNLPGINASKLKLCMDGKSMMQARHKMTTYDDKPCLAFGRIFHSMMECGQLPPSIAVSPFKDYRTKESQDWRDDNISSGNIPLSQKEVDDLVGMYKAVSEQYVYTGRAEVAFEWNGLKALMDVVDESTLTIIDWKTAADVTPRKLHHQAYTLGYLLQAWHYAKVLGGKLGVDPYRVNFEFVFVQKSAPYEVVAMRMDFEAYETGKKQWEYSYDRLRKAEESGEWPGYGHGNIVVPEWATSNEEVEIDFGDA